MLMLVIRSVHAVLALFVVGAAVSAQAADYVRAGSLIFKRTQLDARFRSEGVAAGDFNKDGKMDIAAGFCWYEAPDWKVHDLTDKELVFDPKGYSESFCCFTDDLNHDGWDDIMVVDFPGEETWWFENPQDKTGPWNRHVCVPITNNESPQYLDLDDDGQRELLYSTNEKYAFAKPTSDPYAPWQIHEFTQPVGDWAFKYYHGLGAGDVNGDGRKDVIIPHGWWEAPADRTQSEWTFHRIDLGGPAAQMHVYDFDGDGDADIFSTSAHKRGLWFHDHLPDGWQTREIDLSISETHSLMMADMNADGLPDLITGKRFWSHYRSEPGADDPAVLVWWQLSRENGRPIWTPHTFDHNSGVGTQFDIVDLNQDGLLDVISSNKKGVHYFEQVKQ